MRLQQTFPPVEYLPTRGHLFVFGWLISFGFRDTDSLSLSLQPRLSLSLCLGNAGIKGVYHLAQLPVATFEGTDSLHSGLSASSSLELRQMESSGRGTKRALSRLLSWNPNIAAIPTLSLSSSSRLSPDTPSLPCPASSRNSTKPPGAFEKSPAILVSKQTAAPDKPPGVLADRQAY